jgi:signal transduction histidine kinase
LAAGSGVGAGSGAGAVVAAGGAVSGGGGQVSGFGLAGMRSRVEQAGGVCTVESRPGAGTTVTVQLA